MIGKVMRVETKDIIHLDIFKKAGKVNRHLQIPRLNTHDYPLIAQSSMQELFETVEALQINRSNIIDFVFMLPLQLIVDGKYRCIGISMHTSFVFKSRLMVILCCQQVSSIVQQVKLYYLSQDEYSTPCKTLVLYLPSLCGTIHTVPARRSHNEFIFPMNASVT